MIQLQSSQFTFCCSIQTTRDQEIAEYYFIIFTNYFPLKCGLNIWRRTNLLLLRRCFNLNYIGYGCLTVLLPASFYQKLVFHCVRLVNSWRGPVCHCYTAFSIHCAFSPSPNWVFYSVLAINLPTFKVTGHVATSVSDQKRQISKYFSFSLIMRAVVHSRNTKYCARTVTSYGRRRSSLTSCATWHHQTCLLLPCSRDIAECYASMVMFEQASVAVDLSWGVSSITVKLSW